MGNDGQVKERRERMNGVFLSSHRLPLLRQVASSTHLITTLGTDWSVEGRGTTGVRRRETESLRWIEDEM